MNIENCCNNERCDPYFVCHISCILQCSKELTRMFFASVNCNTYFFERNFKIKIQAGLDKMNQMTTFKETITFNIKHYMILLRKLQQRKKWAVFCGTYT